MGFSRGDLRVKLFTAGIATTLILGCTDRIEFHGKLASEARSLIENPAQLRCSQQYANARLGIVRECFVFQDSHTMSYVYLDTAGGIASVGRIWSADSVLVRQRFDSLESQMQAVYGRPTLRCNGKSGAWSFSDARWVLEGTESALVAAIPHVAIQSPPYLQQVAQVRESRCGEDYDFPVIR
jgi:hypothetical protein